MAMDKQRSKEVFVAAGLPVVESVIVSGPSNCARGLHVMGIPPLRREANNEGCPWFYRRGRKQTARRSWTTPCPRGECRENLSPVAS